MGRTVEQKNEPKERRRDDELARALERAGLELWQSPQGFCAIRIKPAQPVPVTRAPQRRVRRVS
jgi:hypothetical protein